MIFSFFSIFFALLIDYFRPLSAHNPVYAVEQFLAKQIETWFNAGHENHGRIGWILVLVAITIPVLFIWGVCSLIHPVLGMVWNVVILYFCIGFRRYSQTFSTIQVALLVGEEAKAQELLKEWTEEETTTLDADEMARLAIEKALIDSHQSTFGLFLWFFAFGPVGAVFYHASGYLAKAWKTMESQESFGHFAQRAFYWIDWIPVRMTALIFAIVGNFEDAVYAWRNFADRWPDKNLGILLTAGGGALGVRLGTPAIKGTQIIPIDVTTVDTTGIETEALPGEEPSVRFLQNALGLVWRGLLLWLLLLFFYMIILLI